MIARRDSAVREAFAHLTHTVAPSGRAATTGSIRWWNRFSVAVAGTAAVAAATFAMPVALSILSPEISGPPGDPAMGPLAVVSISTDEGTSLVLDQETGKYVELPYLRTTPSPDGTRQLIWGA